VSYVHVVDIRSSTITYSLVVGLCHLFAVLTVWIRL